MAGADLFISIHADALAAGDGMAPGLYLVRDRL